MKTAFLYCFAAFCLTACVKEDNGSNNNETLQAQSYKDLSYGNDGKQKMDIFLPEGRSTDSTKTVVIVHGGGWTGGDKNEMTFVVDSLHKRLPGYAFINLNYRLASNNTINLFPTQENDVKAAIDFYLNKSADYKVSKDLILAGASAGGHLVLLHGYKNDPEKHVKAIIDYFGPTDLPALWNGGIMQQLALAGVTGKLYDMDPAIYNDSSPVNFVTSQSPPTIALQGNTDPLVPASQSMLLINKLTENSIANQLVIYPGGHGDWPVATYADSFDKIVAFLSLHVN